MIITRTPYRVSFFGGSSDYHAWYSRHGGEVLTCTIDKYCHIVARKTPPFLDSKYRVFWAISESPDIRDDIQHPGVRGCLEYLDFEEGVEVNHAGDLPARSGLGSSSAFTVGMLHALHLINGERPDKATLARQAISVEQDVLKEMVGIQDQIQCAWGGVNRIKFETDGHYSVSPVLFDEGAKNAAQDHLILFFTGLQRTASDIAKEQVDNVDRKKTEINEIVSLVKPATEALRHGNMKEFGYLLHQSWLLKRSLSTKITSSEIDDIYQKGLNAGAYGGKILGAGGGGFFLFCCPPEKQKALIEALGLISIPVKFEFGGSQAVLS